MEAIVIKHIKDAKWVSKLPKLDKVAFDDLRPNRKGRNGAKGISGYNIPEKHQPKDAAPYVFRWDEEDTNTNKWWPQGVTGNANSDLGGKERLLMNSWYDASDKGDENHQGARITLMNISDPNNIQYRHILLVESADRKYEVKSKKKQKFYEKYESEQRYTPIVTHAGGIAWYKNYLYMAETSMGIRVFDLNKIFKTEGKGENGEDNDKCGYIDGKYHAFNYEYALPQVAVYDIDGTGGFACISLENINGRRKLWAAPFKSRITGFEDLINPSNYHLPENKDRHIFTTIWGYSLKKDGTIDTNPASVESETFKYAKMRAKRKKLEAKAVNAADAAVVGAKKTAKKVGKIFKKIGKKSFKKGFKEAKDAIKQVAVSTKDVVTTVTESNEMLDINSVNGVYREGDKTWLSRNMAPLYENSLGRLVIKDGDEVAKMWRYPHTPEDLYYEKETDILWSCTETAKGHHYMLPLAMPELLDPLRRGKDLLNIAGTFGKDALSVVTKPIETGKKVVKGISNTIDNVKEAKDSDKDFTDKGKFVLDNTKIHTFSNRVMFGVKRDSYK